MLLCVEPRNSFIRFNETGLDDTKVETLLEDGGDTWLKLQGWEDAAPTFHYVTSYYWAFSQLGVGNTATLPQYRVGEAGFEETSWKVQGCKDLSTEEIHCVSLLEYVFASFVAMASLLIFSTLVSTMTSLMTTLNEIQESAHGAARARFCARAVRPCNYNS